MLDALSNPKSTLSFRDLINSTKGFDGGKRILTAQTVRFKRIIFIPYFSAKSLGIQSETDLWTQTVKIYNINMKDVIDNNLGINVPLVGAGKNFYTEKISYDNSKVAVRCGCPDFVHTFSWSLKQVGNALIGRPRAYRKLTDRPPKNPQQKPGICKHLIALISVMAQNDLFR